MCNNGFIQDLQNMEGENNMSFRQWFLAVYKEVYTEAVSDEKDLEAMEKYEYYCSINGYFPIWDN